MSPKVGDPATILLVTDTIAAVVTHVTPRSVLVRRVATGPSRRVNDPAEPFPVVISEGLLDQPIGPPERYTLNGQGRYGRGSIKLHLGGSIERTDYRY